MTDLPEAFRIQSFDNLTDSENDKRVRSERVGWNSCYATIRPYVDALRAENERLSKLVETADGCYRNVDQEAPGLMTAYCFQDYRKLRGGAIYG